MILKASQRAGGSQLAAHLLNTQDNDHVTVHDLRGFVADDLHEAFQEAYAVSKGTRAKQYLFSLSLNPPPNETVPVETFEAAIKQVEQRLGLENQPRAIVLHEKGDRCGHAHAVWSRIDTDEMKAINLPHYKRKLNDIAKNLYLEHGWDMPKGFMDRNLSNPLNFTREEWQQARRNDLDPRELKQMFRDCWAISDSRKAYESALKERGFLLARGDRRGYVAVDYRGEPWAIAKFTGIKTKQVRERLGDPKDLPPIAQAKMQIGEQLSAKLRADLNQAREERAQQQLAMTRLRAALVQRQREERQQQEKQLQERREAETRARSQRLAKGLKGFWHRLTGKHARIRRQNEQEALQAHKRDRKQMETLVKRQLEQRRSLGAKHQEQQSPLKREIGDLREDMRRYQKMKHDGAADLKAEFERMKREKQSPAKRRRIKRDRGPSLE